MTGHRCKFFKKNGRWHWELYGSNYAHGHIARSRERGYDSKAAAAKSVGSAGLALLGAVDAGSDEDTWKRLWDVMHRGYRPRGLDDA